MSDLLMFALCSRPSLLVVGSVYIQSTLYDTSIIVQYQVLPVVQVACLNQDIYITLSYWSTVVLSCTLLEYYATVCVSTDATVCVSTVSRHTESVVGSRELAHTALRIQHTTY